MPFVQGQVTNQQDCMNLQIPFAGLMRNNGIACTNPYSYSANLPIILDSNLARTQLQEMYYQQNFANQQVSSSPSLSAGVSSTTGNNRLANLFSNSNLQANGFSGSIQKGLVLNNTDDENRNRQEVSLYLPSSSASNAIASNERSNGNFFNGAPSFQLGQTYGSNFSTRHQFRNTSTDTTMNSFTNGCPSTNASSFHASDFSDSTTLPRPTLNPQDCLDYYNCCQEVSNDLSAFSTTTNAQNGRGNVGNHSSVVSSNLDIAYALNFAQESNFLARRRLSEASQRDDIHSHNNLPSSKSDGKQLSKKK